MPAFVVHGFGCEPVTMDVGLPLMRDSEPALVSPSSQYETVVALLMLGNSADYY